MYFTIYVIRHNISSWKHFIIIFSKDILYSNSKQLNKVKFKILVYGGKNPTKFCKNKWGGGSSTKFCNNKRGFLFF